MLYPLQQVHTHLHLSRRPCVIANMHWSTLAVILLGHVLAHIWFERVKCSRKLTTPAMRHREEQNTISADIEARVHTVQPVQTQSDTRTTLLDHTVDATLELPGPNYDQPPAIDPEDNQWEVERLVSKRRIGRVVWYMVKWRGYPASENTWEKKKDIHHKIVAAFEVKLPRERRGSIKPEAYPYGKRPGRPPESEAYRTRFGRPIYPTWKVVDAQMTERWLKSLRGPTSVRGPVKFGCAWSLW